MQAIGKSGEINSPNGRTSFPTKGCEKQRLRFVNPLVVNSIQTSKRVNSVPQVAIRHSQASNRRTDIPLGTASGTNLQRFSGFALSSSKPSLTNETRSLNSLGVSSVGCRKSGSSRFKTG